MALPDDSATTETDPLQDQPRIAAARRLFVEVSGPASYDRLSALAARLLGVGHAKVTLFTHQDTVIGGFGLPPGVVGGPALLTRALSALTVRQRRAAPPPRRAPGPPGGRPPAGAAGQGPPPLWGPPPPGTRPR